MEAPVATSELELAVRGVPWYHTIELPGGVVTPGRWDARGLPSRVPLPPSLAGQRCLDVGSWDGFWAFEMERRGADAVVALDISDPAAWDWPTLSQPSTMERWRRAGTDAPGFAIARAALGSSVEHVQLSVYDVSPALIGSFDFVFIGSLLIHLRDPVRALTALRGVVRGRLLSVDVFSLMLTALRPFRPAADLAGVDEPHWWTPNLAAHKRLLTAAGFRVLHSGGPCFLRQGPGASGAHSLHPRAQLHRWVGLPHAWALAQPTWETAAASPE
jgi:tRNA (mo5U34)-methyltransferase